MLKQRSLLSMLAIVAALVLIAAACSSDSDSRSTIDEAPVIDDTEALPLVDGLTEPPLLTDGACVEGEPDCEDTLVVPPDPEDPPDSSDTSALPVDEGATSSGMTVDGGLTIAEAIATDVTGIIAVEGHIFDGGDGLQLCESLVGLGERYGCDGAQMSVTGLDPIQIPDIVFFEGTTYTEETITLFGELTDGALSVDPLVAG